MVKNASKILLVSLFLLSLLSCAIKPTYSIKEVDKAIKDICKKEFDIEVSVWPLKNTVWVYAPFEELVSEEGQWNEQASEDIKNIFLALSRVFLNIDKPPEFYCLVASNTKGAGADIYFLGFIPDIAKFQMGLISLKEREERVVFRPMLNSGALDDKEGRHILRHEVEMGDFVAFLVRQDIERKFISQEVKDSFQINDVLTGYEEGVLRITLDIEPLENKEGLLEPFEEAKNSVKKFLSIYCPCPDIVEIEIEDIFNEKHRLFTKRALLD